MDRCETSEEKIEGGEEGLQVHHCGEDNWMCRSITRLNLKATQQLLDLLFIPVLQD